MAQLYFYYSAMNAGKSTTLLQSAHNYHERGMRALLYTPAMDDRIGGQKIHSRIGITADAIAFSETYDFFDALKQTQKNEAVHCLLIDEAQFLTALQVFAAYAYMRPTFCSGSLLRNPDRFPGRTV